MRLRCTWHEQAAKYSCHGVIRWTPVANVENTSWDAVVDVSRATDGAGELSGL